MRIFGGIIVAETISMPTDFNIRVYPVNCALKTHSHDFLELAYIRHGWAQHTLNGNTRKLAEGDFVLVDFGEEHSYDVVGGNLEVINCLFRPSAIDASLGHCRSFGELLDSGLIGIGYAYGGLAGWEKVFRDEDGAVRRILDRMLAEMERQEIGFYPMIRALLAELIIGAMRMIRQRAPQTAGTEVQWMMEEIRRDPAAPHFLEEYAARFHMRPEALSRLFVSQAGELFPGCLPGSGCSLPAAFCWKRGRPFRRSRSAAAIRTANPSGKPSAVLPGFRRGNTGSSGKLNFWQINLYFCNVQTTFCGI